MHILYQIAVLSGVEVYQHRFADIDFDNNIVKIEDTILEYLHIVDATGNSSIQHINGNIIDSDIHKYSININKNSEITKTNYNYIKVGDAGKCIDYLTNINSNYTIMSAIYATEAILENKNYYDLMSVIYEDISYTNKLYELLTNNVKLDLSCLKDIIIYGNCTYKKLFNQLVKESNLK